jgi:hypothetical protein
MGVFRIPKKSTESVLLVKEGIGAEHLGVFRIVKIPESVLLARERIGAERMCFGFKSPRIRFARKGVNRSRTDFGVFRILKTPRIRFARKWGNRSRTDLGVFRIPKTPNLFCS